MRVLTTLSSQFKTYLTADKKISLLILFLGLTGCGLVSVILGKELCWDLANYHYYGPYAVLNGRYKIDYWPVSYFLQFVNPAIDFIPYFLIKSFSPLQTVFWLGAIHGLNVWLLFEIARTFFPKQLFFAFFLAIFGMYAPSALLGIGSFQNDNLISCFVLAFVLLHLQTLNDYARKNSLAYKKILFAGLFLGIAAGLKLTAMSFIVGAAVAATFIPISFTERIKIILLWGSAACLGVLLISGYWMLMLWQDYGNPFFPFMNAFFQSPDYLPVNWHDYRFMPKNIWQTLFYPFYFSWNGDAQEYPFRDFRFLVVYILLLLAALQRLVKKIFVRAPSLPLRSAEFWLYAFVICSYIPWQINFSLMRYLVAVEMLTPLLIALLTTRLITHPRMRLVCLTIIFYSLAFFMIIGPINKFIVRAPWYAGTYFNVHIPQQIISIPEATVLLAFPAFVNDMNPRPQNYLIPFFPHGWRFIGIPFLQEKYYQDESTEMQIMARLQKSHDTIFLLTPALNMPELYQAAARFGLQANGDCAEIKSDRQLITHQKILLCPVRNVLLTARIPVQSA